jgi:hypothetical protein
VVMISDLGMRISDLEEYEFKEIEGLRNLGI